MGIKRGVKNQSIMGDYEGGQIKHKENRDMDKQYVKKLFENKNQPTSGDQLSKNIMLNLK